MRNEKVLELIMKGDPTVATDLNRFTYGKKARPTPEEELMQAILEGDYDKTKSIMKNS